MAFSPALRLPHCKAKDYRGGPARVYSGKPAFGSKNRRIVPYGELRTSTHHRPLAGIAGIAVAGFVGVNLRSPDGASAR